MLQQHNENKNNNNNSNSNSRSNSNFNSNNNRRNMKLSKLIFRILKLKFSKKNCYLNEIFEKHKTLTFLSGKIFTLKIMVTNRLQFKLQTFSTFEIIFYIPRMYYLLLLSTSYFYRFPLVFADFEYQMNAYIRHKIAVYSHYLWFVSLQMVKTENT